MDCESNCENYAVDFASMKMPNGHYTSGIATFSMKVDNNVVTQARYDFDMHLGLKVIHTIGGNSTDHFYEDKELDCK